jgi:hypothetical protein
MQMTVENGDALPAELHANGSWYRQPLWISASRALSADGSIREDVQSGGKRVQIDESFIVRRDAGSVARQDRADVGVCDSVSHSVSDDRMNPKPNRRLADLRAYAHGIYLGEVDGIDQGFLLGTPGSLLSVHIDEPIKRSATVNTSDGHVLVFYPYARIPLKDAVACRTEITFRFRPEVGTRLVVFAYDDPIDQGSKLIVPQYTELIFESADGSLAIRTGDAISGRLRSLAELRDFLVSPGPH